MLKIALLEQPTTKIKLYQHITNPSTGISRAFPNLIRRQIICLTIHLLLIKLI